LNGTNYFETLPPINWNWGAVGGVQTPPRAWLFAEDKLDSGPDLSEQQDVGAPRGSSETGNAPSGVGKKGCSISFFRRASLLRRSGLFATWTFVGELEGRGRNCSSCTTRRKKRPPGDRRGFPIPSRRAWVNCEKVIWASESAERRAENQGAHSPISRKHHAVAPRHCPASAALTGMADVGYFQARAIAEADFWQQRSRRREKSSAYKNWFTKKTDAPTCRESAQSLILARV